MPQAIFNTNLGYTISGQCVANKSASASIYDGTPSGSSVGLTISVGGVGGNTNPAIAFDDLSTASSYNLVRTLLVFDTSTLTDNATITAASLTISVGQADIAGGNPYGYLEVYVASIDDDFLPASISPSDLFNLPYATKQVYYNCSTANKIAQTPANSFPKSPSHSEVTIPIDLAKLSVINKTGKTKLILRMTQDATQVLPTAFNRLFLYDYGGNNYAKLNVTYSTGGGTVTVPSKPQSVIASKVNDTTARLDWVAPATDGGAAVIEYSITPVNVTDSTQLTAVIVPAPALTRDFTLVTNKNYNFLIFARNSEGNGQVETSNTITLGTTIPPPGGGGSAPGPPSNLQGVGLNGSIAIGWNTPTTDGGSAITNYVIEYRESAGSPVTAIIPPVLNYILTGLKNQITYIIKVAAKNAIGTGPYCSEVAVSTFTQTESLQLTSWTKFNGQVDSGPEHQFSGLTALSYSSDMTELYNTPTVLYKDLDVKGQVTYRSCKRKNGAYPYEGTGGGTAYYLPPANNVAANGVGLAQALIAYTIGSTYQQPNAGYVADILKYSGRPGDAVAFYKKYTGLFDTPNVAFSGGDDGKKAAEIWKYNVYVDNCFSTATCFMPGWPFEYIQSRPFLRFDTRKFVPLNEVMSAALSFNVPVGMTVSNYDNITHLEIRKANPLTVSDSGLLDGNYDDYGTAVVGVIPVLNNTILTNGQTVTVSINPAAIAINEITKFIVVGSHEATSLPTGWNEFTLENVKLTVVVKNGTIQTPGEPEDVTATPSDKKITIAWTKPLFTGGSEITAYTVKEVHSGTIVTIQVTDPTQVNYSTEFKGLTNGTLYSFIVFASNVFGEGIATPISATPTRKSTGPGAVRDFSGVAQDGKVVLYWNPPSVKGSLVPPAIIQYIIKNTTTGGIYKTRNTTYEITGLTNGFPYTFQIQAGLVASPGPGVILDDYDGPVSTITLTPTSSYTVPGLPDVYSVYAAKGYATVYWIPSTFDGGLPVLGWRIKIEAPASNVFKPMMFNASNPNIDSYTIYPLNPDSTYIISVAAYNAVGVGPYDDSDPFILLTGPTDNSVLVDVNYNYSKFYTAPVELNRNTENYEDFIYPKEVTEEFPATISSTEVAYPLVISASNYILYLHYEAPNHRNDAGDLAPIKADYQIPIAPIAIVDNWGGIGSGGSTSTTFDFWPSAWELRDIVEVINTKASIDNIPIKAESSVNNRLVLKSIDVGDGVILDFSTSVGHVTPANIQLFGEDPTISKGSSIYLVKNYVPTAEYDAVNEKALVESRVWTSVRNSDISTPSLYVEWLDGDAIVWDLPTFPNSHTNIKPNSVTIQYFDDNGKFYALRDYFGDGRLMYRRKVSEGSGEPITLEYPKDVVSNKDPYDEGASFGTIDYETGSITGLIFPTIFAPNSNDIISTFKSATIVGYGVKWPIFVNGVMWLYFVVNNRIKHYQIEPNDPSGNSGPASYLAAHIAAMLNAQTEFVDDGLIAGVGVGGQLYVKYAGKIMEDENGIKKVYRQHVGPTSILELLKQDNSYIDPTAGRALSANKLFFGLNPITLPVSKVYLTYSFTNNDPSPYKYVWYQTPHFALISRGVTSQYITKGHLEYLLDKLSYFKPINTKYENTNFTPVLNDSVKFYDELNLTAIDTENIEPPYIFITSTPPGPAGYYHVIVVNPDGQQNGILMDVEPDPNPAYTYVVPV